MICPFCGVQISDYANNCGMCGNCIDRRQLYGQFMKKGDDALDHSPEAAVVNYRKALEFINDNPEGFIKYGIALEKKGDKSAANMFLKAIALDFNNELAHNHLISLYDHYGKLQDIKLWYEKNRTDANSGAIDRFLKVIAGIEKFKGTNTVIIQPPKGGEFLNDFVYSMKSYSMSNMVLLIVAVLGAAAFAGVVLFKTDTSFIMLFAGAFFTAGLGTIIFTRLKRKSKKTNTEEALGAILKEYTEKKDDISQ